MTGRNALILLSDERMRDAAGCYGHRIVQTPAIDRLAARGTRFANAYTPSPICVPARAALATGRHVHFDDPEAANRQAFADQAALIERLGGRDAILASDDFDFTPLPDEQIDRPTI